MDRSPGRASTATAASSASKTSTTHTMSSQINGVLAAIRKQQDTAHQGERHKDFVLLDSLLQNRDFRILLNLHSSLSEFKQMGLLPSCSDSEQRASTLHERLGAHTNGPHRVSANRVRAFLETPSLKAILRAHDIIAREDLRDGVDEMQADHITKRNVVLEGGVSAVEINIKASGEPLGCALKAVPEEDGSSRMCVTRVFVHSLAARTDSIFADDEVFMVNGKPTRGLSTQEVSTIIKEDPDFLSLVIIPLQGQRRRRGPPMFMRARFDYSAEEDTWLPCDDGGISFSQGDVLEILEQNGDWWQARVYGDEEKKVGLVPSEQLQAKRMEAQAPQYGIAPQAVAVPYERVTLVQPSKVYARPIVLLGAEGVGRRTIKEHLTSAYPNDFASPITHTSCELYRGVVDQDFCHVPKETMSDDIKRGLYLEHGQHEGDLYGIYKSDVLALAKQGKTCVLDTQPSVVDLVRTPEIQAYVLLIMPPNLRNLRTTRGDALHEDDMREIMFSSERLLHTFGASCDKKITNHMLGDCVEQVLECVRQLHSSPQWVPSSWAQAQKRGSHFQHQLPPQLQQQQQQAQGHAHAHAMQQGQLGSPSSTATPPHTEQDSPRATHPSQHQQPPQHPLQAQPHQHQHQHQQQRQAQRQPVSSHRGSGSSASGSQRVVSLTQKSRSSVSDI